MVPRSPSNNTKSDVTLAGFLALASVLFLWLPVALLVLAPGPGSALRSALKPFDLRGIR